MTLVTYLATPLETLPSKNPMPTGGCQSLLAPRLLANAHAGLHKYILCSLHADTKRKENDTTYVFCFLEYFGELYNSGQQDQRTQDNTITQVQIMYICHVRRYHMHARIRKSVTSDPYPCLKHACALIEGGVNSYMDGHL